MDHHDETPPEGPPLSQSYRDREAFVATEVAAINRNYPPPRDPDREIMQPPPPRLSQFPDDGLSDDGYDAFKDACAEQGLRSDYYHDPRNWY